ncbi:MAG: MlaD family protein, partial [bacterium]
MRKNRLFWLGLFITGGLALIVWGIFFLGKKEKIFEQTFHLYVTFENVVGLRAGTAVRLSGID